MAKLSSFIERFDLLLFTAYTTSVSVYFPSPSKIISVVGIFSILRYNALLLLREQFKANAAAMDVTPLPHAGEVKVMTSASSPLLLRLVILELYSEYNASISLYISSTFWNLHIAFFFFFLSMSGDSTKYAIQQFLYSFTCNVSSTITMSSL